MAGDVGRGLGGALTAEGHVLPVRVYYEDTDFSGAVYHGSFVRFLERGRTDFLRAVGVTHGPLSERGLHFVVSEREIVFRRAAAIDDLLEVVTNVASLSGARIVLNQAIRRDGDTIVSARVTAALIHRSGRPRRLPDDVLALLKARLPAPG